MINQSTTLHCFTSISIKPARKSSKIRYQMLPASQELTQDRGLHLPIDARLSATKNQEPLTPPSPQPIEI